MAEVTGQRGGRAAARRVAVIVVHGVGDTEPGLAMNELVDTLAANCKDQVTAQAHSEVYRLASPPIARGEPADTFVAYARNATLIASGDKVRFFDLHWADLTHMLPGRFNAFLGSFRIIFESHHFIDAMLPRDAGLLTRRLRWLLIWAAAILRGPIVGASACLVAVGLALYFGYGALQSLTEWQFGGNQQILETMTVWLVISVMIVLFAAALFIFYRRAQSRETEWNDVYVAVMFGSVFVGFYTYLLYIFPDIQFLRGTRPIETPMCLYVNRFYYLTQSIRAIWYLFLVAALALVGWLYLFGRRSGKEARPSAAMAATSIVVLQSALWLTLLSAFAIPIIRQAQLYQMPDCGLEGLYVSFAGTAALLGAVGSLILLTYLARASWARLGVISLDRRARLMPRLLFGGMITLAILSGALFQGAVFGVAYVTAFVENNVFFETVRNALATFPLVVEVGGDLFEFVTEHRRLFYAPIGVLAVGVSLLITSGATTGVHIARDLIDHHYNPRLGYSHYLLPRRWRVTPRRPRRLRIRERLNTLAAEVICKEPFDDLVFVVHSQGSVIVYDYLRTGGAQCEQLLCARPHVITFGSPLGHLYQFYFREYANLDRGISALSSKLASWTNLYRVDDYVGREIGKGRDSFVRNEVMPAGGHIDYWREPWLSEALLERIRTPGGGTRTVPATQ